jgi:hypothetical protein
VEQGDPRVAVGTYMMALFVLGLGTPIGEVLAPQSDEIGTLLDAENLPKRVRPKRDPQPK